MFATVAPQYQTPVERAIQYRRRWISDSLIRECNSSSNSRSLGVAIIFINLPDAFSFTSEIRCSLIDI
tara:strand:+ start:84 stop:287 length:204 start_codon:yes stop_codon:yes gene_type:complete